MNEENEASGRKCSTPLLSQEEKLFPQPTIQKNLNKRRISVKIPSIDSNPAYLSYEVNEIPLKGANGKKSNDLYANNAPHPDISAMSILSLYQTGSIDSEMDTSR